MTEKRPPKASPEIPTSKYELFDCALRTRFQVERLIGVDEVGRGPLAGPVVAAAVILPSRPLPELRGVRDSKRLSPKRRLELFRVIRASALEFGLGWSSPGEIDERNILRASLRAMRRAVEKVDFRRSRQLVLVDGNLTIPDLPAAQEAVVSGDGCSLAIAAASIVAKVLRDRWMRMISRRHPGYGFERNMGYGTAEHFRALQALGPTAQHRRTFIRRVLEPALSL